MARKRKPGRPPGKKASKKADKSHNTAAFWRAVAAIGLIILGLVLLFGAFIQAPVPHSVWHGFWWALGAATVVAPVALIYLGALKFINEEQRIPLPNMAGTIGLLVFLASWFYAAFLSVDSLGNFSGGHGGQVGQTVGNLLVGSLGKFLASLVFFILTVFSFLFTFAIEPRVILKLLSIFKRAPKEETNEEDLGALKQKMNSDFQLHEGVPVEHHAGPARMPSAKASAQKLTPDENHAALTAAKDPDWQFPSLELLSAKQDKADAGDVKGNAETIKDTFANFGIDVSIESANVGPRVTQFTLKPPTGVKLSRLTALENNLALDLAATSIRMEAPIPGKRAVGIEVPNVKPATVTLRGLLSGPEWSEAKGSLNFAVGKDIAGEPVVADLEEMPHLLIAGQTKSGKSVMINAILASFLYRNSPSDVKLILVDPKHVEMAPYEDIPHLLAPVVTEPEKCISALKWATAEMERRLKTFADVKQRDIQGYNSLKQEEGMPHIVIVIDELFELMSIAPRDVEGMIARLASKARAAGIHLVLATQRPDANVVTGIIKANVPAQIAFAVKDQVNSRIIIDQGGAEKLLGKGDMLFKTTDLPRPLRIQAALITGDETNKLCEFLRAQRAPQYDNEVISQPVQLGKGSVVASTDAGGDDDETLKDAVSVVVSAGKASTSLLQRKLRVGYGRASRLMDIMEERGIIAMSDGTNRPREVLVSSVDEVFGEVGSETQQAAATAGIGSMGDAGGDVYDDMPDEG
ncbi:MAG TPA: DNA translocase FtsK 4TM domain-containing protein [Candidatus Saccharimonadales bacterium]|nr:DNA translocase FtsK 4TM domain-containing protein [Candidatus Saccharimonadales bacterium]